MGVCLIASHGFRLVLAWCACGTCFVCFAFCFVVFHLHVAFSFHPGSLAAPLQWMARVQSGADLVSSVQVFLRQMAQGTAPFNVVKVR